MPATPAGGVRRCRESGSVMIVAVLILLVVTATALLLASSMRVEVRASANHVEAAAAASAAEGAVRYVMSVLAAEPGVMPDAEDLQAEGVIVGDAAYWLIRPAADGAGYEPGIADEAGKLHLNRADVDALLALPGVTQEMADSLIAWRTFEEEAMDLPGAGAEHYLLLDPPYLPKHSPLESVEELLLIRGWSRAILFGEPEDDGDDDTAARRTLTGSVETDAGLYDFLTVYSHETPPADAINVNDPDRDALRDLLEAELSGERFDAVWSNLGGSQSGNNRETYESMLDFFVDSGMTAEEFDALASRLTIDETGPRFGRINVNTASETVLATLPGLDASDAAALVDARVGLDPSTAEGEASSLAWIVEVIGDDKAFEAGPHLTDRAAQFTVDVVAIGRTGRAFKRYRVVIDTASEATRVVRWSDWTERGWPLDPELREALRGGMPLEEAVGLYGKVEP
ncbi:MAG: hypothetical protein WD534_17385 [Phycisphaeraceae bacterium]